MYSLTAGGRQQSGRMWFVCLFALTSQRKYKNRKAHTHTTHILHRPTAAIKLATFLSKCNNAVIDLSSFPKFFLCVLQNLPSRNSSVHFGALQIKVYKHNFKIFQVHLKNCEKRLSASIVCLSVRPSAWNNSAPPGRIFTKFDIGIFFENILRKSKFH